MQVSYSRTFLTFLHSCPCSDHICKPYRGFAPQLSFHNHAPAPSQLQSCNCSRHPENVRLRPLPVSRGTASMQKRGLPAGYRRTRRDRNSVFRLTGTRSSPLHIFSSDRKSARDSAGRFFHIHYMQNQNRSIPDFSGKLSYPHTGCRGDM